MGALLLRQTYVAPPPEEEVPPDPEPPAPPWPAGLQRSLFYHPPSVSTNGAPDYGQIADTSATSAIYFYTQGDEAYRNTQKQSYGATTRAFLQYLLVNNAIGPTSATKPGFACGTYNTYPNTITGVAGYKSFCADLHGLTNDFMRDSSGNRLREVQSWNGSNHLYLLDPASTAWRSLMASYLTSMHAQFGYSGFFLDNCDGSLWRYIGQYGTFGGTAGQSFANYSRDNGSTYVSTPFRNAMAGLLQHLRATLPAGCVLMGNMTNAEDVTNDWDQYMGVGAWSSTPGLDGGMDEEYLCRSWEPGGYVSVAAWEAIQSRVERMTAADKHYCCVSQALNVNDLTTNTAKHLYALCSYLLVASWDQVTIGGVAYPLTSFRHTYYSDYFNVRTIPQLDQVAALGYPVASAESPSGARYQTGANTWRRTFSGGYVTVNNSTHVGTFTLT